MKLLIGLGNPGKEYENNRHNVGFMVIDALREKIGFPEFRKKEKFSAEVSEGNFIRACLPPIKDKQEKTTKSDKTEKIFLAKPKTFMNLSGKAVKALKDFYHIEPTDLWVIYDDIDLPLGTIRIREKGSAGTHNGMKSIIESIGTTNFPRIRIGVENRVPELKKQQDLSSYILSDFHVDEKHALQETISHAIEAIEYALNEGIIQAKTRFSSITVAKTR